MNHWYDSTPVDLLTGALFKLCLPWCVWQRFIYVMSYDSSFEG